MEAIPIYNVTFKIPEENKEDNFKNTLDSFMSIITNIFHRNLGYKFVKIERLSFVDYKNNSFFRSFPFNKELIISNTSNTLSQFGFGKFNAAFFEVIASTDVNSVPKNFRIFYEIKDTDVTNNVPPKLEEQVNNKSSDTIFILGSERDVIRKGRASYIEYDGKLISMTEAKKLDKKIKH